MSFKERFKEPFKEYWRLGGPVGVVLGLAGIGLLGETVRYLYWSDVADNIAAAKVANTFPFFLQVYGLAIIAVVLITIALTFYTKMKRLEQEKDIRIIEALQSLTEDSVKLLQATPKDQKGGMIATVQQNLADIKRHLIKILQKAYADINFSE